MRRVYSPLPSLLRPGSQNTTRLYSTTTTTTPATKAPKSRTKRYLLEKKNRRDKNSPAAVEKQKKFLKAKDKRNKDIANRKQNEMLRTPAQPRSRLEMVQQAVIKGDAKAAYEIAERLPPSITKFDQLLSVCGKTGKVQQSFKTYNDMKKAVAEGKGESEKLFERANWILNEMDKSHVNMNIATLNVFLKVCVKHGHPDKAIELCEKLEEQEIVPDLVTYSLWITAHKNRLDKEHPELVQHDKIHELENNEVVTNTTRKQLKPIFDLYEHMKSKNILPHLQFFNTWLQICRNSSGPSIVFEVFAEMKKARVKADYRTFDILLSVCANTNRIQYGMDLFKTIHHGKLPMDTQLANSFLRLPHVVYFNANSSTEEDKRMAIEFTERVLAEMKERKIPFNLDTYQILIALYGRQDNPEKVNEMFSKLESQGLKPNIKTYTSLLAAFRITKQVDAAHDLYKGMVAKNIRMDSVFSRNLLKFYRESSRMDYAEELVNNMRETEERLMAPKLHERQEEWDQQAMERQAGRERAREKKERVELRALGRRNAQIRIERKAMRTAMKEEMGTENVNENENTKEEIEEEYENVNENAVEGETEREIKKQDKKEKRQKYVSLYSEDEDEAFIPEVSESLFKLALERHKTNSMHIKPKIGQEIETAAQKTTKQEEDKKQESKSQKSEEDIVVENPKSPLHQLRKQQSTLK